MRVLGHPLCVGIDPYLSRILIPLRLGTMAPGHLDTSRSVEEFCCRFIDLIARHLAIVKPQASLFECLGWRGWQVLDRVIRYAHELARSSRREARRHCGHGKGLRSSLSRERCAYGCRCTHGQSVSRASES